MHDTCVDQAFHSWRRAATPLRRSVSRLCRNRSASLERDCDGAHEHRDEDCLRGVCDTPATERPCHPLGPSPSENPRQNTDRSRVQNTILTGKAKPAETTSSISASAQTANGIIRLAGGQRVCPTGLDAGNRRRRKGGMDEMGKKRETPRVQEDSAPWRIGHRRFASWTRLCTLARRPGSRLWTIEKADMREVVEKDALMGPAGLSWGERVTGTWGFFGLGHGRDGWNGGATAAVGGRLARVSLCAPSSVSVCVAEEVECWAPIGTFLHARVCYTEQPVEGTPSSGQILCEVIRSSIRIRRTRLERA